MRSRTIFMFSFSVAFLGNFLPCDALAKDDDCLNLFALVRDTPTDEDLKNSLAQNLGSVRPHQIPELIKDIRDHHGDESKSESVLRVKWIDAFTLETIFKVEGEDTPRASEERLLQEAEVAAASTLTNEIRNFIEAEMRFMVEFQLYHKRSRTLGGAVDRTKEQRIEVRKKAWSVAQQIQMSLRRLLNISSSDRVSLLQMIQFLSRLHFAQSKFLFSDFFESLDANIGEEIISQISFSPFQKDIDFGNEFEATGAFDQLISACSYEMLVLRSLLFQPDEEINYSKIYDKILLNALKLAVKFNSPSALELAYAAFLDIDDTLDRFSQIREQFAESPAFLLNLSRARTKLSAIMSDFGRRENWDEIWELEGEKALGALDATLREVAIKELNTLGDKKLGEALTLYRSFILRFYRETERRYERAKQN